MHSYRPHLAVRVVRRYVDMAAVAMSRFRSRSMGASRRELDVGMHDPVAVSASASDWRLRHALLLLLLPTAPCAFGSFGGAPCGANFGCHFSVWGVLIGMGVGIPLCCMVFIALHLIFCNPARSRPLQAVVGACSGALSYELAAVGAALGASRGMDPMLGLLAVLGLAALGTVSYARSPPRQSGRAGR